MSDQIVFVDTETTGLDPDRHEIWEAAFIVYEGPMLGWREHVHQLPVDLGRADAMALKIGRFHERRSHKLTALDTFARSFAYYTAGKHLCGNVVSFDEERLRKLLRANGSCPEWHYHLIDVEALAVGYLAAKGNPPSLPWNSEDISRALGIEPDTTRHEALYDAQWAKQMYDAIAAAPPNTRTAGTEEEGAG